MARSVITESSSASELSKDFWQKAENSTSEPEKQNKIRNTWTPTVYPPAHTHKAYLLNYSELTDNDSTDIIRKFEASLILKM